MGIRLESNVIYGVQFTTKETKAFEAFMKDKPKDWLLMRYVEQTLAQDWKTRKDRPRVYDDYILSHYFHKIDAKTKKVAHPYRPFWSGLPKKYLETVEQDVRGAAADYLKQMGWDSEAQALFKHKMIIWPESRSDNSPTNIFGYLQERRYASEIDYALLDILGIESGTHIYTIKGKRPWECGTVRHNRGWHTLNIQNMLPINFYPNENIIKRVVWQRGGSMKQYIAKKKEIWDKYHKDRMPYKNYPCEGWNGSDFYFYPVDMLFKLICKHVPAIRYDVMRLEKFLIFYWC